MLGTGLLAAMTAAYVAVLAPGTAAAVTVTAPAVDCSKTVAPNVKAAARLAADCGTVVEALASRSEFQQVKVDAAGIATMEIYLVPQRVHKDDGSWADMDKNLRAEADGIKPVATLADVRFSAGGTGPLVTWSERGSKFELGWPTALPAPVLEGDTARYVDVIDGVDLLLTATIDGFRHVLQVKTADALANPALRRIAYKFGGDLAAKSNADGTSRLVNRTGETVITASAATMWDSAVRTEAMGERQSGVRRQLTVPADMRSSHQGPGVGVKERKVGVAIGGGELALTPDSALLSPSAVTLPLFIDPSYGTSPTSWAPVEKTAPTTSYPSGTAWPRDYIRSGRAWGETRVWRTHMVFNISAMSGQTLMNNPTFSATLDHSGACADTAVGLWHTAAMDSSPTWNEMNGGWLTHFGNLSGSANDSCSAQNSESMAWTNATMKTTLQSAVTAGASTFTVGLRATDETDEYQWKRWTNTSARLSVTYNTKSNVPTALAIAADCTNCDNDNALAQKVRPVFKATVSDPNGDAMTAEFQVTAADQVTQLANSGSAVTNVANNATPTWTSTVDLPEDQVLYFRVRTKDPHPTWGDWSPFRKFVIDATAPVAPTVSSPVYLSNSTGTYNGGAGLAAPFTINPNGSTDVVKFETRWNGGTATPHTATPGQTLTVDLAPPSDLGQVLEVRSIDDAARASNTWTAYPIKVKPASVDKAYWKFDEATGLAAMAANGGSSYTATLSAGTTFGPAGISQFDPGASGNAVNLDAAGEGVTAPTVLNTNTSFTISAWVKLTDTTGYKVAAAQNGTNQANARLDYSPDANSGAGGFCFRMRSGDNYAASNVEVCAPTMYVITGEWVYLAGVYDQAAGKIRLHVDGGPNNGEFPPGWIGEADATATWVAKGDFSIGYAKGGPTNVAGMWWSGAIDEVRAYQRVVSEAELTDYFMQCSYGVCAPIE